MDARAVLIPASAIWLALCAAGPADALNLSSPIKVQVPPRTSSVAVADFNRDRHPDLLVGGGNESTESDSRSAVLLGRGDGTFDPFRVIAPVGPVGAGDVNGDGFVDAIVFTPGGGVYLGSGDGALRGPTAEPDVHTAFAAIAVEDMNGDGRSDLVSSRDGRLRVFLGTPEGTFARSANADSDGDPAVADFNGDRTADVALVPGGLFLGAGDGTLLTPPRAYPEPFIGSRPVAADFNRDGHQDFAAQAGGSQINVALGDGAGGFSLAPQSRALASTGRVAAGDLNFDGIPDLAVAGYSDEAATMLGNGDGTFAPPEPLEAPLAPRNAAIADLNGDGSNDVVIQGVIFPFTYVYLNRQARCPAGTTGGVVCLHRPRGGLRITGTSRADRIIGSSGPDVIHAGAGNDAIDARAGNDVIDGGAGNDRIVCGTGRDRFTAGRGDRIGSGCPARPGLRG